MISTSFKAIDARCFFVILSSYAIVFAKSVDRVPFRAAWTNSSQGLEFARYGSMSLMERAPVIGAMSSRDLQTLEERQSECAFPVPCSDDTCCPANTQCCVDAYGGCCQTNAVCRPDLGFACCPNDAQTCGGKLCAKSGSICCGASVCDPGFVCNTEGEEVTCCLPSEVKCANGCCPEGTTCAAEPGYCTPGEVSEPTEPESTTTPSSSTPSAAAPSIAIPTLPSIPSAPPSSTTPPESSAASSSSTSSSTTPTPAPPSPAPPSPAPPSPTPPSIPTPSIPTSATSAIDACDTGLSGGALLSDCDYECHNGTELPVMSFVSVPGLTDQLVASMCAGIAATSAGRGDGVNYDILTWLGSSGAEAEGYNDRRREAKCKGFCAGQKGYECDEYPPAATEEGGEGALRTCIPKQQNSGTQGPLIQSYKDGCNLQPDDQFVIRIIGGCARSGKRETSASGSYNLFSARQASPINLSSTNGTLLDPFGDGNITYVAAYLSNLTSGTYSIKTQVNEVVDSISVVNSDGAEYYSDNSQLTAYSFSFDVQVDDEDELDAALVAYTHKQVNLTYEATVQPSSTNTPSDVPPPVSPSRVAATSQLKTSLTAWLLWTMVMGLALVFSLAL